MKIYYFYTFIALVKLRCIMGCPGLNSSYREKSLFFLWLCINIPSVKIGIGLPKLVVLFKFFMGCWMYSFRFNRVCLKHSTYAFSISYSISFFVLFSILFFWICFPCCSHFINRWNKFEAFALHGFLKSFS